MSVGLQRLREEPDLIRRGALDKGEDPALVDRAVELDTERRRLLAERDALKASRNQLSGEIGRLIKGGANPASDPEVVRLKAESTAVGERAAAADARVNEVESEVDDLVAFLGALDGEVKAPGRPASFPQ